ncbi:hypothetical protein A2866_05015 [Candidatus Roizmanbacteria bacterium RIFCSPHIGHO2_01_FULL_39_8]|uniref:Transglycosylase n=2 Tax=Candidatus Roizmaniibacteriota TaxID=1752723 RepID=A0A1F7GJ26_9BACT|nr:MAG: hypothetical protein A2866_05015 [Candidatus Roizmanbacteria bacterium RIFCSPHIGHO2_01_FULL_39_8]OGK26322.1 MAG: hypothetical protein A3C28_02275 [Candidatus Roizmanbacteria bacterium RIFCSPHIGHO2_02_FULL_39_9]
MSILLLIVLGLAAGWLASVIMGTSSQGVLSDIIFGVLGALVGGLIMNLLDQPGVTGFNVYSILVAALGAMVLIWIGRRLRTA